MSSEQGNQISSRTFIAWRSDREVFTSDRWALLRKATRGATWFIHSDLSHYTRAGIFSIRIGDPSWSANLTHYRFIPAAPVHTVTEGAQWGPATAADAARGMRLDHRGIVSKRDLNCRRYIWGFLTELRIQNHKTPSLTVVGICN